MIPFQPPLTTPDGEPRTCPRCGRIYERSVTAELDGQRIRLEGHVPGDAVCRTAEAISGAPVIRDARDRRAVRARL